MSTPHQIQTLKINRDELNHLNAGFCVDLDIGDRIISLSPTNDASPPYHAHGDDRVPSIPDHLPFLGSGALSLTIQKLNAVITYLKETEE